VRLA
jgi:hypothetical protein